MNEKLNHYAFVGAWGGDIQGTGKNIYSQKHEGGINTFRIDDQNKLTFVANVTPMVNSGIICVSSDGQYLYSTDERKDLDGVKGKGGGVCAYKINRETGELIFINEVSSAGAFPCYIAIDSQRRYVFVSNHASHDEVITRSVLTDRGTYIGERVFDEGSVAMFPVHEDGSLGECCDLKIITGSSINDWFQWTPHPHSVVLDPNEKFLLSGDKGIDQILVFEIDYENGKLLDAYRQDAEKGSASRHLVFHPTLPVVYCNSEQNNTVHAYKFDFETGKMSHFDRAKTIPDDYKPEKPDRMFGINMPADICIHKSGNFLFVSNRGHNSIVTYRINAEGKMELMGYTPVEGEVPRIIEMDAPHDMMYSVNQRSGNVVQFSFDSATGVLTPTGEEVTLNNPTCIDFL